MIKLVMVLHCHQPVGNFDNIFHKAVDKCYLPVLKLLDEHARIHLGMHFSGCLLEWIEANRPEVLELLAGLVGRGQVEPLSGGFYEPLLAAIPTRDARGQILMLNDYIEEKLGRRPTGFWLTERIWDPSLPATLDGTDMEYTVVDDTHFYYAGLKEDDCFGPYVTEREGKTLKILATPMIMRYMVPFKSILDVMNHLRHWNWEGRGVAIYGDDGEKFGLWPGTHEWVLEKGWLNEFFTEIEGNSDWLNAVTPAEYLADAEPIGRIYMPQASYEEMTEWALSWQNTQAIEDMIKVLKSENRWEAWRPFVRGGVWDNFLVKYEESNRLHKKMIFLSDAAKDDPEIRDHVWRAQCNCAYWHGVFGGLYMGHLRRALHDNLIKAQAALTEKAGGGLQVHQLDYDKDGFEELLIHGPAVSLGVDPNQGGTLFEIADAVRLINLTDVLTRRPEAYHRTLPEAIIVQPGEDAQAVSIHDMVKAKEANLERFLIEDPAPRSSLRDHFLAEEITPEDLAAGKFGEIGDFSTGRYEMTLPVNGPEKAVVRLSRLGSVQGEPVLLTKTIYVDKTPNFSVEYEFEGDAPINALYGCEFNLSLFSDVDEGRYLYVPERDVRREAYETGAEYDVSKFDLIIGGDGVKVGFQFSKPLTVCFYPIITVSMSEDGFEKSYQGTSLFFFHPLSLTPGAVETLKIDLALTALE